MPDFSLVFTILRRDMTDAVLALYEENHVPINYVVPCNGTAKVHMLNLMGLEQTEKSLILSLTTERCFANLRRERAKAISFSLPDTGISFSVPLSGLDGKKTFEYIITGEGGNPAEELAKIVAETSAASANADNDGNSGDVGKTNTKEDRKMDTQNELIIAICEAGYTEMVMDAARSAGARGGTTVKAKGTGAHDAEKFFGMTITQEREAIFIVCPANKRNEIMAAIKKDAGIDSKAHTLMFSLPVSSTDGFGDALSEQ